LEAAETGIELVVCLASQVTTELAANLAEVEAEAQKRLARCLAEARRIDASPQFLAPKKLVAPPI